MLYPWMGGPGGAGTEGLGDGRSSEITWGPLGRRNLALERQMAANSRVGAGMAADCGWDSALQEEEGVRVSEGVRVGEGG